MNLATLTGWERTEISECVIGVSLIVLDTLCAAEYCDDFAGGIVSEDPAVDISCAVGNRRNFRETTRRNADIFNIGRHTDSRHLLKPI
jgi:hypothetical protein